MSEVYITSAAGQRTQVPPDHAVCPKCNGSTRRTPDESLRRFLPHVSGYDAATDTLPCDNCGGQTMFGRAVGYTKVDPATGKGCLHSYSYSRLGNCWHGYTCRHCEHFYDIDSGD